MRPRAISWRSRKRSAVCTEKVARSVSSAVTRITGQTPPMSHNAINSAAKNPLLTLTYQSINARVQSLRFRTNQNEAKWKIAVKEHQEMLDALTARDSKALGDVLTQHMLNKRDTILDLMRKGAILNKIEQN